MIKGRRNAAKSPSPEPEGEEGSCRDSPGAGDGLVIANQNNSVLEDEEDGDALDDDLKADVEETMSLLIDSRLLHKDFISDNFALALVFYRKVSPFVYQLVLK